MTPTVSVVVPLHDGVTTVEETLRSVLAQTFDDWELLVVDDASTDDGPERVRAFDRARLLPAVSAAPRGPSAARNRGLAEATGTYLAFLDADDVWAPGFLARHVATLEADPELGMVWGPARYWYPEDPAADHDQPTGLRSATRFGPGGPAGRWLADLRGTPCPSATLFRRSAVRGYPEELRRGEDIAACLLVAADHPTSYDPEVLVRYRRHPESATRRSTRAGTGADDDLTFARWAVSWAASRPELGLRAVAARTLHSAAHRRATDLGWFAGRREIARIVLATAGARHRWWALVLDGALPLVWSRRVAGRLERPVRDDLD